MNATHDITILNTSYHNNTHYNNWEGVSTKVSQYFIILLQYNNIWPNPGYINANMFNNDVPIDSGCTSYKL